jgi:hypothetical protein
MFEMCAGYDKKCSIYFECVQDMREREREREREEFFCIKNFVGNKNASGKPS